MRMPEAVEHAHRRIAAHVEHTPTVPSPALSAAGACRVHLKLENLQRTGSFKLRGAMNKLLALTASERQRGVVAASTGNHGAAVAAGGAALGCPVVIFAPRNANPAKLAAIRAHDAEVVLQGDDCVVAEACARDYAGSRAATYISPYNDPLVIAGQGTIGLELIEDVEHLDAVVVAVGGGGLIAGIGGYLRSVRPEVEIIGCSPRNSAVMHASLQAGHIVELESMPTLADATAGGIEPDSVTFDLCRSVIDDFLLVDEAGIAAGMRTIADHHGMAIEGAAGLAVAAFVAQGRRWQGRDVAIVVCGGNVLPAA